MSKTLYHVTTPAKAKKYRQTWFIRSLSEEGFTITRAEPAMSDAEFMEEAMMEGFDQQDASFAIALAKKYRGQS